jgi:2',3'-cyclic-nucleotide 2'-phosphodiesterase (5'-nucleotidase family)
MRRPRLRSLLVTSLLLTSLVAPTALAAQDVATPVADTDSPLILAAVSGWDSAVAESLVQSGSLPVLASIAETGSRGDLSAPGSTGPALATLLTGAWPGEHGVVGDVFFRTGSPDFADVATWSDPGIVQADTLPLAAERAGKLVAAVGWPGLGDESTALQGPVIGTAEAFTLPGVARSGATEDEIAAAAAQGAGLDALEFAPAESWESLPQSFSEVQEASFTIETTDDAVNPDRTFSVLAIDTSDDGKTNYDQLVLASEKNGELSEPATAGTWGDAAVTLDGDMAGGSAGFAFKVLDLAPDLSEVSIYVTPISRIYASWASCEGVSACVVEGGFAESVQEHLGPAIAVDDAALRAELIDAQTFGEQAIASLAQAEGAVTYLTSELGVQPDLLLLGASVGLAPAEEPGDATPVADGSGASPDAAYQAVDALLGTAQEALGGNANLVLAGLGGGVATTRLVDAGVVLAEADLAETAQPGNCVPAPVTVPEGTPDPEALPDGPQVKACWNGQVAQIYLNLDGREAAGSVSEDDAGTLQDAVIAAFTALEDPDMPDAGVVAGVFRHDEVRNVDGLDLLHPSRTGDVVVVLNAPYRFGEASGSGSVVEAAAALAPSVVTDGVLYAAGPALAAGADLSAPATDVAPTSAMLLGVPGPKNASGNLLLNAFRDGASLRNITILDISDFHGQLPPLSASADTIDADGAVGSSYPVGGVAALDTWFDVYRANARGPVLLVAAGDSVGATPPISTAFGDKPTIEFMNIMDFTADGLGNHNFDVGAAYMAGELAPLAEFPYLSVNLVPARDDATPLPEQQFFQPSLLLDLDGATIGLIGFSNPDIPSLTRPGALDPYRVIDPVQPITDEAARLREQGAAAVVALGHMGALSGTLTEPSGPVVDVADAVQGVDVVIGDHTDVQVSAVRSNGVLLTENRSKGVMFTRINLVVNVDSNELVYVTTDFHRPWVVGMTPDPEIVERLEHLQEELAPTLGQVIGSAVNPILRSDSCGMETGRTCESLIGNVLTDAMRASYNTDFALTNSGGIRAALTCPPEEGDFCPTDQGANVITQGQVLTVLPFGNVAVTVEITGAELKEMLEVGVAQMPEASGAFPQISGFCFTYDISREPGDRVTGAVRQAADGSCTGDEIDFSESATYTLTTNDFTASGGDGYPNVLSRSNSRDILANVLADSISETSALALPGEALDPQLRGRITCVGEGCPVPLP